MKLHLLIAGVAFLFTFILLALLLPFNTLTFAGQGQAVSFLIIAALIWLGNYLTALCAYRYATRNVEET